MFSFVWQYFLYQPLFNALIWIYSNIADKNLGWAVVWLTVFLRVILLPLTIIAEKNVIKQEAAEVEAATAVKSFRQDPEIQKEVYREIIKKHHISPWARTATLLLQLLVLVLLYQVFVGGIAGYKVAKTLYSVIDYPGKLNINFYGFAIGKTHDFIWAGICAIYLFISIFLEQRGKTQWDSSKFAFLFIFPLFTFTALWILPMVKSLFILTSMIFSDIIHLIMRIFKPAKN